MEGLWILIILLILGYFHSRIKDLKKEMLELKVRLLEHEERWQKILEQRAIPEETEPLQTKKEPMSETIESPKSETSELKELVPTTMERGSKMRQSEQLPKSKKEEKEEADLPSPLKSDTEVEPVPKTEWELLIGGKWLNRIGAVALIFGIAFFLKYAFDHQWMNPVIRIILGGITGIGLLGAGAYYYRKQLSVFAQGLTGSGIAILYISVFAGYNFYHLLPLPLALIGMTLITIVGFWQALTYRSLAIAILGWIGGYLTPLLLEVGNLFYFYLYLWFLTFGMLLMTWKRKEWWMLYFLTFFGSHIYLSVWQDKFYFSSPIYHLLYILGIWILFYVKDLMNWVYGSQSKLTVLLSSLNALFLGIYLFEIFPQDQDLSLAYFIAGLVYLLPIVVLHFSRKDIKATDPWHFNRQQVTFILFVVLATWLKWDSYLLVTLLGLEAAAVVWWGLWARQWLLKLFGSGLFALDLFFLLIYTNTYGDIRIQTLTYVWLSTLFFICGYGFHKYGHLKTRLGYHILWTFLLLMGLALQLKTLVDTLPRFQVHMILATFAFLYGFLPTAFAYFRRLPQLYYVAWVIMAGSLVYLMKSGSNYQVYSSFVPVCNIRFALFLTVFLSGLLYLWIWRKYLGRPMDPWFPREASLLLVFLIFELVTVELDDYFDNKLEALPAAMPTYEVLLDTKYLVLCLAWIFFSLCLYGLSIKLKNTLLFWCAWVFLILGLLPLAAHAPSVTGPIFNLRFLSFAIAILTLWIYYYTMAKRAETNRFYSWLSHALLFLLAFFLWETVTVEIQWAFAPDNPWMEIGEREYQKQLSLSLGWIVLSASFMFVGMWKKIKGLRMLSFGLFGITILKIFLIDLSFLGTFYRIFSFVGLGLVLLFVSYLYTNYRHRFK